MRSVLKNAKDVDVDEGSDDSDSYLQKEIKFQQGRLSVKNP